MVLTFQELVDHAFNTSSIDFFLSSIGAENMIKRKVPLKWYDNDLLGRLNWC